MTLIIGFAAEGSFAQPTQRTLVMEGDGEIFQLPELGTILLVEKDKISVNLNFELEVS